jgi:hypothetical protein
MEMTQRRPERLPVDQAVSSLHRESDYADVETSGTGQSERPDNNYQESPESLPQLHNLKSHIDNEIITDFHSTIPKTLVITKASRAQNDYASSHEVDHRHIVVAAEIHDPNV